MQRKVITKEIKEEVLAKVKAGEKVLALAEQYGISTNSIYTWIAKESGDTAVSTLEYNRLKRENEELKRLIGELTLDMSLGGKNKSGSRGRH